VIKGRNIIETWSKLPVQFISGNMTYDFSIGSGGSLLRFAPNPQIPDNQIYMDVEGQEKPEHPE
jgi:hypothetical protein